MHIRIPSVLVAICLGIFGGWYALVGGTNAWIGIVFLFDPPPFPDDGMLMTGTLYFVIGAICLWAAVAIGRKRKNAQPVALAAVILSVPLAAWDLYRPIYREPYAVALGKACVLASFLGVGVFYLVQQRRENPAAAGSSTGRQ